MNIFDYYIEKNKDANWVDLYRSTANKNNGKTFLYINTNYRSIYAFIDIFSKFYKYNNLDRNQWQVNANHGQEEAKQWVINMAHSKLFKKDGNHYSLTAKGEAFKAFIDAEFDYASQWPIIYMFLNNAYFGLKPNYINKTCESIMEALTESGFTYEEIVESAKEGILNKDISITDLFKKDIFWILTFYKDKDFLYLYKIATQAEKEQLHNFCISNYKSKIYSDCISYKFKPSGQYAKNTFIDDLKTLFVSISVAHKQPLTLDEYVFAVLSSYKETYSIEEEKIFQFVDCYRGVFQAIFKEVFGNNEDDIISDYEYTPRSPKEKPTEEKIDDTTTDNEEKIKKMSAVLKRMTKERAKYLCELHDLHDCRYFTSKESNKNYLEIHHLVPREFSNEFEKSIEIIDNYVPLCPHCHRMLHLATDRERLSALTYLYNKRNADLKAKHIEVSLKELRAFYGIEE